MSSATWEMLPHNLTHQSTYWKSAFKATEESGKNTVVSSQIQNQSMDDSKYNQALKPQTVIYDKPEIDTEHLCDCLSYNCNRKRTCSILVLPCLSKKQNATTSS